jgi:hypothetical protein
MGVLGLLQAATDRGIVEAQMGRDFGQPIPILAIRRMDESMPLPFPLKQNAQRRLRLSTGNVLDDTIGLMLGHKFVRAEIDLPRELLPGPRPASTAGHKGPILFLSRLHSLPKLS